MKLCHHISFNSLHVLKPLRLIFSLETIKVTWSNVWIVWRGLYLQNVFFCQKLFIQKILNGFITFFKLALTCLDNNSLDIITFLNRLFSCTHIKIKIIKTIKDSVIILFYCYYTSYTAKIIPVPRGHSCRLPFPIVFKGIKSMPDA